MSAHGWTISNISVDVQNHQVTLSANKPQDGKTAMVTMIFPLHVTGHESLKDADHHAKEEAKRVLHSLIAAL